MSAYVIEAYGMNDKVQEADSDRQYVNGDRMNVVLVRGYHDFIAGSDANRNRISQGFSFPFESRVDDFNAVDRFPVCMLWNKFISSKDFSRTKLNVKLRENFSDSKTVRNIDVSVDELLVSYVQALVNEFKQKYGIETNKNQKDHYIIPIPNELTEYSQEYLIRSFSSKNVEVTLIWREVAALMKFIEENKSRISFKEGQRIKVAYLGEDSLESAVFELRRLKNEFVPVRTRPKIQKRVFSGFDYLCQSLRQKLSGQKECSDKTLWEIFNTRSDYVKSALGKTYQEEPLPLETGDSHLKTIVKSIVLEPDVENKFIQSDLLNRVVQLEHGSGESLSLYDFVLENSEEKYDAILLCGDIATEAISAQLKKKLSSQNIQVWASDTDLIVEGSRLYHENLKNDRPTYLDCLPKLEIAYYSEEIEDWSWMSLVKEGQFVEGGKEYNSLEPFKELGIPKGHNSLPIYLRVESTGEGDDGIRFEKRIFEKVAPEDLRLYITVSMKAAFGLARIKIKDELNFYSDNGFIFDYSKMKKKSLDNLKTGLSYPSNLTFGPVFPADEKNQNLIEICQYLENYIRTEPFFRLDDEDIKELLRRLPYSRHTDNRSYKTYDLEFNTRSEINNSYLNRIWKIVCSHAYELQHRSEQGYSAIKATLNALTKLKVFYRFAPVTLKEVCRQHLACQISFISPQMFFGTSCKVLYDSEDAIRLIYWYINNLQPGLRKKIYYAQGLVWLLNYIPEAKNVLDRTTADNMVQMSYDMLEEQLVQNNFKSKFYTATLLLLVSLKYRAKEPDFMTPNDSNPINLEYLNEIYEAIDSCISKMSNATGYQQRYYEKIVHMHEEVRNFIEKKGNQEFLVALNDLSEKDD